MPPTNFPLRWETTGHQWWYVSPIDWAAANGHYELVRELLYIDPNLLFKLTSLRRIHRLETMWDDELQFDDVAKNRSQVAQKLLLECKNQKNALVGSGYGGWLLYTAASLSKERPYYPLCCLHNCTCRSNVVSFLVSYVSGRILNKEQRELEKRVIAEELLSSWLNRKLLEEKVIRELFREDTMLQRAKDSIASDCPEVTSDACNKPLIDLQKCIHMQYKGEGSALIPDVQGPITLNGQGWNYQSPGNHTDGGLTGSLSIQRPSRAPNSVKPEMFIGLGNRAMTPLVSSVKECTSLREDKVDTLMGGDPKTAGIPGKMITKRKHWECDLCNVLTDTESVLKKHLTGKKHLAKQKASSRTATSLTFDQDKCEKTISSDNNKVLVSST